MSLNRTPIPKSNLAQIVTDIQKKRELRQLSPDFVKEQVLQFLQKNHRLRDFVINSNNPKSVQYKTIIKQVRASLRKVYGLFRMGPEIRLRREACSTLLKTKGRAVSEQLLNDILSTHSSTRERIPSYGTMYGAIFRLTGVPHTIIDLGCGLNPFSIPFMKLSALHYQAYDISVDEITALNEFFAWLHSQDKAFTGKAEVLDITNRAKLEKIPPADLCFLFKMTEVLDQGKGHTVTEAVLKAIPARYIIISFSTRTMSGKAMTAPRRRWMEWLCKRLHYQYTILEFGNEILYVVKKG